MERRGRYPEEVKERAVRLVFEQATPLFADRAGVHEDALVGRPWSRKGQRPVVRLRGRRRRLNMFSAMSPRGWLSFQSFEGTPSTSRRIEFLKDMSNDARGRIILILERHPAHVATATRRWLAEHEDRITVHFFSAYAPEMNPDKHGCSQRKGLSRNTPGPANEDLAAAVTRR